MTEDVAALRIRLEATTAKFEQALRRTEGRLRSSSNRMERRAKKLNNTLSDVGSRFGINLSSRSVVAAGAIAGIGLAIRAVVREGDKILALENRFTALTGSAERGAQKIQDIYEIVASSGGTVDGAASSLTRFTIAAQSIGATDAQVLDLTKNITRLGQIGGSTTQEITSGATQLGQALASGVLQGEELKSILENLPLVARELADGLGVGVGQLREMGKQGELTADRVFGALIKNTDEINDKFETAIEGNAKIARERLVGAFSAVLVKINDATGASRAWAGVLNSIADTMESIASSTPEALQAIQASQQARAQISGDAAQRFLNNDQRSAMNTIVPLPAGSIIDPATGQRINTPGVLSSRPPQQGPSGDLFATEQERRARADLERRTLLQLTYGSGANRPRSLSGNDIEFDGFGNGTNGGSGAGGGSSRGGSRRAERVRDYTKALTEQITALEGQRGAIGLSGEALVLYEAQLEAAKLVQDAENEAKSRGVPLSAQQKEAVLGLADAYVKMRVEVDKAVEAQKRLEESGAIFRSSLEGAFDSLLQVTFNLRNAINDLARQLASQAFRGLLGSTLGGGGLGIPGFANGTNSAPGGLALVGERGPELVNLPKGSQVIPNERLGQMSAPNVTVVVVDDPNVVGEYLNTPQGHEAYVAAGRRAGVVDG